MARESCKCAEGNFMWCGCNLSVASPLCTRAEEEQGSFVEEEDEDYNSGLDLAEIRAARGDW